MKPVSRKTESIATSNDTSSMFSIFAAARNACKGSILKFSMTFFFIFRTSRSSLAHHSSHSPRLVQKVEGCMLEYARFRYSRFYVFRNRTVFRRSKDQHEKVKRQEVSFIYICSYPCPLRRYRPLGGVKLVSATEWCAERILSAEFWCFRRWSVARGV